MSTGDRVHYAENAITPAAAGDGTYSKRQHSLTASDQKHRTTMEKEIEADDDERDIKRKQVRSASRIAYP